MRTSLLLGGVMEIDLFYRDGANYKQRFTVDVDEKYRGKIKVAEHEDDFITMEDIGLTVMDIPMVQQYGYDAEHDHNFVLVEAIR